MSARKGKKAPAEKSELQAKVELTASQLFTKYMAAVGRANGLAKKLEVEIIEADRLSNELAERFGVHVGNRPPAHKTQPVARKEPVRNEGEEEPPAGTDYRPPAQVHSEAPRLSAKESQDVAQIRLDAGLSAEEQADAEALEGSAGPDRMAALQRGMGGKPVIPSPGVVEGVPEGPPDAGPDNREGGPVTQKSIPEEE